MSARDRTWSTAAVVMCVAGMLLIGASWFWAARTMTAANRELILSLQNQSTAIARLAERLDALDQTCSQAARVSGAAVASAAQVQHLSPEQLEHLSASVATHVAEANAPPPAPEPTPESLAAQESAQKLVAAAVRAKHWTEADRDQMRLLMPQLSSEQFFEVQRELAAAINRQELRPDVRGPLF